MPQDNSPLAKSDRRVAKTIVERARQQGRDLEAEMNSAELAIQFEGHRPGLNMHPRMIRAVREAMKS